MFVIDDNVYVIRCLPSRPSPFPRRDAPSARDVDDRPPRLRRVGSVGALPADRKRSSFGPFVHSLVHSLVHSSVHSSVHSLVNSPYGYEPPSLVCFEHLAHQRLTVYINVCIPRSQAAFKAERMNNELSGVDGSAIGRRSSSTVPRLERSSSSFLLLRC